MSSPPELLLAAAENEDDRDSALGDDATLSTASVASSILHYRTINGRTYHNDKHTNSQYFTPNDNQQQESIDIAHHAFTLLIDGKLFLAPIPDTVDKVVDIGTGTGIWAIDFADIYENADVIGTDLSPIQPAWVPPNVKFEIDDAAQPWTWPEDSLDFVHIRFLTGAIADWNMLFAQAFRCLAPGGWLQSCEFEFFCLSDDGTTDPAYDTLAHLYEEGGKKMGHTFRIITEDIQINCMKAAGFVNIQEKTFKMPIGGWPADPKLADIGRYIQLALETDLEGYTLYMWNTLLNWGSDEYQNFLINTRKAIRNKASHVYFNVRFAWGQKPETSLSI